MTDPHGAIDRMSSVPFHYQLQKLLEQQIGAGRWGQGDRLPSEPILSDYYRISRATVRQALHTLEQEGLIRKEKGRGAFVNRTSSGSWLLQWVGGLFDDELTRRGVTVESTVVHACVDPLPDWASEALRLRPHTQGVRLERLRSVEGEVALYVINHLPREYAAILGEVERTTKASLYQMLREQCGVEVAGSTRVLEAVSASAVLARHLGVPSRCPLFYIQSVARDATGRPVDCYRAWLRTDRLRIAVETDTWAALTGRVVSHSFVGVPNDGSFLGASGS